MTQIQEEVARLQSMADALVIARPKDKDAVRMANAIVPNIESLRELAFNEIQDTSVVSGATYNTLSQAMAEGEDVACELDRKYKLSISKLVSRQFDNVHIMMNLIEEVPQQETHKCWPPWSTCH